MQIAVHHFDAGSIVVHLHDNDRDRIIELHGNVMTAMTGQQFQTALCSGSCLDRLIDAVLLDGVVQFLVVIYLAVDRERMLQEVIKIRRVQTHGERLALFGDGEVMQRLIIRFLQPV